MYNIRIKMIDPTIDQYQRGKTYKLSSAQTDEIYIGSTIDNLSRRLSHHKTSYNSNANLSTAVKLLQYDDVKIELLEEYSTTSKTLLELREGEWIKSLKCVNITIPCKEDNPYKYEKGKIYKLTSNQTDEIYIGSTCTELYVRLSAHRKRHQNVADSTASKILIYNDVKIELIEAYSTTSKYFLEIREAYWIKNTVCVNKVIPRRTHYEYYIDHKEEIQNYMTKFREDNKDDIKLKQKIYQETHKEQIKRNYNIIVKCDICNKEVKKGNLCHHKKSHK